MNYIYHRVPPNLRGNILYPLNTLKTVHPAIYEREVAKYEGREHVPKQHVPLFDNCLWNDVLFFTAVDPNTLFAARREAGWPDMQPQRYFKIDPQTLDQSQLGIFLFQPWTDPTNYVKENFTEYRYEDLAQYAVVPQETKDYFKHEFETGSPFVKLLYRYVPHVLYHGNIDISHADIITIV